MITPAAVIATPITAVTTAYRREWLTPLLAEATLPPANIAAIA